MHKPVYKLPNGAMCNPDFVKYIYSEDSFWASNYRWNPRVIIEYYDKSKRVIMCDTDLDAIKTKEKIQKEIAELRGEPVEIFYDYT